MPPVGDELGRYRRRDLGRADDLGSACRPDRRSGTAGGTTAPQPAAPKGISLKSACKLSSSRKAVVCTISASSKTTRLTGTVRVSRTKLAATKSATGSVKVTVRSTKKLKKGQKMALKVRYGKTIKILTVKAS